MLQSAGWFWVLGIELGDLDFLGKADLREQPDAVVVGVELVPGEAVTGADGMGMVVVVPAFTAGEEGDPPVVAGVIFGLEATLAPEMRCGVNEPGGVQADGDAKEGSPEHHAKGADDAMAGADRRANGDLDKAGGDEGEIVEFAEPDVNPVAGKIWSIAAEEGGFGVEGAAREDPTGVCPPGTVVGSVWVAFLVRVLMMDTVSGYPEDGSAFESEAAAGSQEVLDPLGRLVTAVGEQAVIGHADADVDGEDVHDDERGQVCPGEEEQRGDGSDVEQTHGNGGDPVNAALLVLAAHAQVLFYFARDLFDHGEGG